MSDTAYSVAPASAPPADSAALVLGLAQALHKRAIYPLDHPLLKLALEGFASRAISTLELRGPISIGVARSSLVIDSVETDSAHPLLSELASHLHAHHLAGLRMIPGVTREELQDFVAVVATPADRVDTPLGLLPDADLHRWRHIALMRTEFERLEMAGETKTPPGKIDDSPLWLALARSALNSDADTADEEADFSPSRVARALNHRVREGDDAYVRGVAAVLAEMTSAIGNQATDATGTPPVALRRLVSQLVQALEPETLKRLLELAGDDERRMLLIAQAVDALAPRAVVDIVAAGATASGRLVSGSMMRLLSKLARHSESPQAALLGTERLLRKQVKQLLADWTLDDPNPEGYARMLREIGVGEGGPALDRQLDVCEPERLLEICLESGTIGPSSDLALGHLVTREGLAGVLDRLSAAPWSETREAMINSLVNGVALKEQLSADKPDHRVLTHVVARLREKAVEPLLETLHSREHGDTGWIAELLIHIGDYAVPALTERLISLNAHSQRVVLTVFDRLSAWPKIADLRALGRHPDPSLRREALRLWMRNEDTRMEALTAGARDPDERILAMVVSSAVRGCDERIAAIFMERLEHDEGLGEELRARAVRAIATSGAPGALRWLARRPLTQHWLFRFTKLRKGTPEMLACMSALAAHWPEAPEAALALLLARRNPDGEYRRAAMMKASRA